MTERPPALRDPHRADVMQRHHIDGTSTRKKVGVGCSSGATIETYTLTSSVGPEGC